MRYAAVLLDQGINTDLMYAHLQLKDFDELKFRAQIYKLMKITENGVAYVYLTKEIQDKYGLKPEAASACISAMETIKGCLCWIGFIENGDEEGSKLGTRLLQRKSDGCLTLARRTEFRSEVICCVIGTRYRYQCYNRHENFCQIFHLTLVLVKKRFII